MKKQWLFALSFVLLCAGLTVVGGWILVRALFTVPNRAVAVTGNTVDNEQNNFLAGARLVRIDDKLYYYYKDAMRQGLYEIDKGGVNPIRKDGPNFLGYDVHSHAMRLYNGKLVTYIDDELRVYHRKTQEFRLDPLFKTISDLSLYYQEGGEKFFYLSCDGDSTHGSVCLYENGESKAILNDVGKYYAVGDAVYYLKSVKSERGWLRYLCKYNVTKGNEETVADLSDFSNEFTFILEDHYCIFEACEKAKAESGVYKIDFDTDNPVAEMICIGEKGGPSNVYDITSFNVYNGCVYVSSHHGLKRYDLRTDRCDILADGYVEACYILDDTWVYYVGEASLLWRVSTDGTIREKVFG